MPRGRRPSAAAAAAAATPILAQSGDHLQSDVIGDALLHEARGPAYQAAEVAGQETDAIGKTMEDQGICPLLSSSPSLVAMFFSIH
jgi:hypothetical protein